ncbi:hypothetical protein phiRS7_0051 [Staphylococcus phage phiRS7]|uniref:hypothetical protein n=1 Tax=Staphylococcus phage phiRS7 TaxID=1403390 RepID=UPI0003B0C3C7|nr:hypothetical protein phiRS7_0051 [Staphylococcus phage phiRS7]AGW43787.1 hypothetical protein phiRS7_0051 [Staphylococcus phage phiRS7]MDW4144052.1 hypothetical protein [Staphylococcus saprophyticus]
MKIKRKVEMTHEEYAKYMIDKFGIASYERELIDNNIFDAPMEFEQTFTLNPMRKDDDPVIERSFKGVVIEVEEEIDEDTVFEEILLIVNNGLGIEVYSNYSINDVLSNNEGYYEETVMLILKPDPEVIWTRENGLVE